MIFKILLLLIGSCFIFVLPLSADSFDYCKEVNKVRNKITKELFSKHRLICYREGGGLFYQIEEIEMSFEASEISTIDQARILYINVIDYIVDKFNSERNLRPYFVNYPFSHENINLKIRFPDNKVSLIFKCRGTLFYSSFDRSECLYTDYYEEPYQDALRLVYGEKTN